MKSEFEDAARSVEKSVSDELRSTEDELNRSIAPPDGKANTESDLGAPGASGPAASTETPAPEKAAPDAQAKA
jgi:hypothetical protein